MPLLGDALPEMQVVTTHGTVNLRADLKGNWFVLFSHPQTSGRFLEPDDRDRRVELFEKVKKLYRHRSRAVHGGRMKPEATEAVEPSAALLQALIRKCAELGAVPDEKSLVL